MASTIRTQDGPLGSATSEHSPKQVVAEPHLLASDASAASSIMRLSPSKRLTCTYSGTVCMLVPGGMGPGWSAMLAVLHRRETSSTGLLLVRLQVLPQGLLKVKARAFSMDLPMLELEDIIMRLLVVRLGVTWHGWPLKHSSGTDAWAYAQAVIQPAEGCRS